MEYHPDPENILPVLKRTNELFGYISQEHLYKIAAYFSRSPAEIFSAASFFTDLRISPPAQVEIQVCMSAPCELGGASQVLKEIEGFLGARADRDQSAKLAIKKSSCHGRCGRGPLIIVNGNVYEQVKPSLVDDLLSPYFSKK